MRGDFVEVDPGPDAVAADAVILFDGTGDHDLVRDPVTLEAVRYRLEGLGLSRGRAGQHIVRRGVWRVCLVPGDTQALSAPIGSASYDAEGTERAEAAQRSASARCEWPA